MTAPEFSQKFQALIEEGLSQRVPVVQILHNLMMAQLELGYMHCAAMQQMRMHAMAEQMANESPKIIKPNN